MACILVVDDDESVRAVLEFFLQSAGHTVVTAEDGVIALDKLESNPVDLVLLDAGLPRLPGIDAARAMKASPATRHIPILMMTAAPTRDLRVIAANLGIETVLVKPFDVVELKSRVEECAARNASRMSAIIPMSPPAVPLAPATPAGQAEPDSRPNVA